MHACVAGLTLAAGLHYSALLRWVRSADCAVPGLALGCCCPPAAPPLLQLRHGRLHCAAAGYHGCDAVRGGEGEERMLPVACRRCRRLGMLSFTSLTECCSTGLPVWKHEQACTQCTPAAALHPSLRPRSKVMRVHAAVAGRHTRHGQLLPLEVYLEEGIPLVSEGPAATCSCVGVISKLHGCCWGASHRWVA